MNNHCKLFTERLFILLFLPFVLQPAVFAFTKDYNMLFVVYNLLLFLLALIQVVVFIRRKMYKKVCGMAIALFIIVFTSYYEWTDRHALTEKIITESPKDWKFHNQKPVVLKIMGNMKNRL